ncbi:TPA: hypothetical protein I8196_003140 [Citrobacter freundii]|uniref:hypothetical protein n=1 Tax=Citrobacter freundii complex TaxID=1344959 RepID=UPI00157768D6|nr:MULTISPECIES: hypothetical protein [Citrobacter freundii complex]ELF4154260.1 hypothetical protein [Citrobacter freundii]MBJ8854648.1 hypothetical protein [Citrobacter freundii]NTY43935.1 hypothetical protein [Citrobacter freundii]NUN57212.1 hypothetical protein [Citrobacter freundii]HAT2173798.1 hypothetical protein [Citrobacter freundii]
MSYSDVVATLALLISVLGTFLSGYFSYRFAIKGEKRKEYNSVADKITLALMEQRARAVSGKYPDKTLSNTEVRALLIVCDTKQQTVIRDAFTQYKKALGLTGEWVAGTYHFRTSEPLIDAIDNFRKCCPRK